MLSNISVGGILLCGVAVCGFGEVLPEVGKLRLGEQSWTVRQGAPREIYQREDLKALRLYGWPDGTMGVLPEANGQWLFFSASATPHTVVRTVGSTGEPAGRVDRSRIRMHGQYNYLAGGPVVEIEGKLYLMAHAERFLGSKQVFHSSLVLTRALDLGGNEFAELGPVITSAIAEGESKSAVELGAGPMVVHGEHLYVFHRDRMPDGAEVNLAAARVALDRFGEAIRGGQVPAFEKWFEGEWREAGVGGRSSPLEPGNPLVRWMDVKFSPRLGLFVAAIASNRGLGGKKVDLRLIVSRDGLRWSDTCWLSDVQEELFYPTLVEMPESAGLPGRFLLYHTASRQGGFKRPENMRLVVREVELRESVPAGGGG